MKNNIGGFTLIESVLAMVVLAFGLLGFTRFLVPQFTASATPHYQARAAALGNAFLNDIMGRDFDQFSDPNGGQDRCNDTGMPLCSESLGLEEDFSGSIAMKAVFNDVDDYIGCWAGAGRTCLSQPAYVLSDAVGQEKAEDYANFLVDVAVYYDKALDGEIATHSQPEPSIGSLNRPIISSRHKRIDVTVDVGRYGSYVFSAYRSNY